MKSRETKEKSSAIVISARDTRHVKGIPENVAESMRETDSPLPPHWLLDSVTIEEGVDI